MTDRLEELKAALADRYEIEREIGQGGMATVYLAEDLKHHRKVAVKVLRPELAAVLGADRFVQEITTTANLHSPRLCGGGPKRGAGAHAVCAYAPVSPRPRARWQGPIYGTRFCVFCSTKSPSCPLVTTTTPLLKNG